MLIPWGSDAPIYHWPIATGALIAANVAVLVGQAAGAVDPEVWGLAIGQGIHPAQWLTHNFLHFGPVHLVGNMVFLWVFGLIVEGKLGWGRFLALALGIGVLHGAGVQLLTLGAEPTVAYGASAVVYGLMAVCLVWAPTNEITCYGFLAGYFRIITFTWDIPIWGLALFYILQEAAWMALGSMLGMGAWSALGHLSGAVWGLLLGTLLVRRGWVDCEGWDLYSLLAKRAALGRQGKARERRLDQGKGNGAGGRPARKKKARTAGAAAPSPADDPAARAAAASRAVEDLIAMGDIEGAVAAFDRHARTVPGWPPREDLLRWIKQVQEDGQGEAALPLMRAYCDRHPDRADRVRLRMAQLYLGREQPVRALRQLDAIDPARLGPELAPLRDQLRRRAVRLRDEEGVLELEGDD